MICIINFGIEIGDCTHQSGHLLLHLAHLLLQLLVLRHDLLLRLQVRLRRHDAVACIETATAI